MEAVLPSLVQRLENVSRAVIPWSSPVPSFGDISTARIATLGLNPSNREFVDEAGTELDGKLRRFHTLKSLGISRWSDATTSHLHKIRDACSNYFCRNPYDGWFKRLDHIISGTGASYYGESRNACHLDLVPYATACKWTDLHREDRTSLLSDSGDSLGLLLRDAPVEALVLNGRSVIAYFEKIADIQLKREKISGWELPRQGSEGVPGVAYTGFVKVVSGVQLARQIMVLGFNHNIQSSFGVTKRVTDAIRRWVATTVGEALA